MTVTEVPEEAYDTRPLYQRLEEQKMRKDAEYEEAHKLSQYLFTSTVGLQLFIVILDLEINKLCYKSHNIKKVSVLN